MELQGKIAGVTGAGSGIGQAVAIKLASEGAKLALLDINEAGAKVTADKISEAGGKAHIYKTDITDKNSINSSIKALVEDLGKIDI